VVSVSDWDLAWEERMATKKTKSAPVARKVTRKAVIQPRVVRQAAEAATVGSDSNRLLREAAWSRMFGRVELKNPFTR
jgi:hypothetical protein